MKYLENEKEIEIPERRLTIELKVKAAELINQYKQDKATSELNELLNEYFKAEGADKTALIAKANLLNTAENDIEVIKHNSVITQKINELISIGKLDFSEQPLELLEGNVNSFCGKAKLRNLGSNTMV